MTTFNIDDWAGPFTTREQAINEVLFLAGPCESALWQRSPGRWFANDGIDPDTGEKWATLPTGATFRAISMSDITESA